MEEDHAPLGEFGAPLFKVVLYRLIRMIAVYVDNIDRVIGNCRLASSKLMRCNFENPA